MSSLPRFLYNLVSTTDFYLDGAVFKKSAKVDYYAYLYCLKLQGRHMDYLNYLHVMYLFGGKDTFTSDSHCVPEIEPHF